MLTMAKTLSTGRIELAPNIHQMIIPCHAMKSQTWYLLAISLSRTLFIASAYHGRDNSEIHYNNAQTNKQKGCHNVKPNEEGKAAILRNWCHLFCVKDGSDGGRAWAF
jgi:hypothetical protein